MPVMPRLQRSKRKPKRYVPPHAPRAAAKRKPRRGGAAGGAAPRAPVFDWRINELVGMEVEPVSADKPLLQQRMHFHVSTSYKRTTVSSWEHESVFDEEESFTFEQLQGDSELGELVLGALWEFVRDSYVANPTQEGMYMRLGQHAPERLPPLTQQQALEQEQAFERTRMQQAAAEMAADDSE